MAITHVQYRCVPVKSEGKNNSFHKTRGNRGIGFGPFITAEQSRAERGETSKRQMRGEWDVCLVLVVVHVSKPPEQCVCLYCSATQAGFHEPLWLSGENMGPVVVLRGFLVESLHYLLGCIEGKAMLLWLMPKNWNAQTSYKTMFLIKRRCILKAFVFQLVCSPCCWPTLMSTQELQSFILQTLFVHVKYSTLSIDF